MPIRGPAISAPKTSFGGGAMIISLSLILAMQVAAIPPALPQDPGPERRAAAAALFPREPYVSEYSWGINIAASRLSGDTLTERGVNSSDRDFRFSERLIALAKAAPDPIIDEAIKCVAEPIAQRLYVPDLAALKTFASSPEGRNFWTYYMGTLPWHACFSRPVRDYLAPYLDEELAAVLAETSASSQSSQPAVSSAPPSEPPAEETLFAHLSSSAWADVLSRTSEGQISPDHIRRVACAGLQPTYMLCAWEQRIGQRWLKMSRYADISLMDGPIRLIGDPQIEP